MRHRHTAAALGAMLLLTLAFTIMDVGTAFAITRNQVIARAQVWIDNAIPYSQRAYFQGYRTDCSGFASMAWGTGTSWTTSTMHNIAFPIPGDQLNPGDAMLRSGSHVRIFYRWLDAGHTYYVAYEQTTPTTICSVHSFAEDVGYGYVPYRYKNIVDSPPPLNMVVNPTFDVWSPSTPLWWSVSRDVSGTVGIRRRDAAFTSPSSLGIINRSTQPVDVATATQTVPVSAGTTYRLSCWVVADSAPAAVQLQLRFLGATGETLAATSTAGDAFGVNGSAFRQMVKTLEAPLGTVSAKVTLALVGNTGAAKASASTAIFDDVYLVVVSPVSVYRFYNFRTGTHFYTGSGSERDSVADNLSGTLRYEGPAYTINLNNPANTLPVFRFYNFRQGVHFYTASPVERDQVIKVLGGTYRYEGPAYNVSTTSANAFPVYRFYNFRQGVHFYTANAAEMWNVANTLSSVYRYEGISYYVGR